MNGNTYPPEHEFLDVPSREDSVSPVPNGDSNYDALGPGGANLSRITTGKSGRVIERLMSDVDRFLASPPHQSPNPSTGNGRGGESRN